MKHQCQLIERESRPYPRRDQSAANESWLRNAVLAPNTHCDDHNMNRVTTAFYLSNGLFPVVNSC